MEPKIAFLIAAHHQPEMLARLIARLQHPDAITIVHVDRKASLEPFRQACDTPGVVWLDGDDRVGVNWAGCTIVDAHLKLWRASLPVYPSLRRIVMLSGVDYPLRDVSEICATQLADETTEFLRIDRRLDPKGLTTHDRAMRRWCTFDILPQHNRLARRVRPYVDKVINLVPRPAFAGGDVYHGAAFYSLTTGAAKAVLAVLDANPAYVSWWRWARSSVEMFVQTCILQLPDYRDRVSQNFADGGPEVEDHIHGVHYIDWTAGGPHPKALGVEDVQAMLRSGALFSRKIDPGSEALLDQIDAAAQALVTAKTGRTSSPRARSRRLETVAGA